MSEMNIRPAHFNISADPIGDIDNALERLNKAPDLCQDADRAAVQAASDEALSADILAWAEEDPILASLIKQYLNANRSHRALMKSAGARDPMSDIAADMVDSAWCMIQTRLLELKAAKSNEGRDVDFEELRNETAEQVKKQRLNEPAAKAVKPNDGTAQFMLWMMLMSPQMWGLKPAYAVNAFRRVAS